MKATYTINHSSTDTHEVGSIAESMEIARKLIAATTKIKSIVIHVGKEVITIERA